MADDQSILVELDQAELAVRLCEAAYGLERPPGMSAAAALAAMDPEPRAGWLRAAHTAVRYFIEVSLAAHSGVRWVEEPRDMTRQ